MNSSNPTATDLHEEQLPKSGSFLYFIGIGGISMSSLAALARHMGYRVEGSDIGANAQIDALRAHGITVHPTHDAANLNGVQTVIYTAAVTDDNPELLYAHEHKIPCMTRAHFLGLLMREYRIRIGVSGTHGKSTTTGMVSDIFLAAQTDPTIVSGAVMPASGLAYRIGSRDSFLFEACEYTDSFLSFYPTTAVVLNVEMDHVDYFHSMEQLHTSFACFMNLAQLAVVNADSPEAAAILRSGKVTSRIVTVSLEDNGADYFADDISFVRGCGHFRVMHGGECLCRVALSVPGRHNVSNALAALAAAVENGIDPQAAVRGLAAFTGAARRFEKKGELPCGASVYDDYAHHPSEIRATLSAARAVGGRVRCVFQPHSYSRTVALFDDFVTAFSDADEVIFADIYINLEAEHGAHAVTSADLARAVTGARYMPDLHEIADYLAKTARSDDLILLMGAGSVYHVRDYLPLVAKR